jgi:hypothetical protein
MTKGKTTGLLLATAAAALFTTASVASAAEQGATEAKVHCAGVNACKGTSECSSASNGCKGQNACKGQGWLYKTEAECKAEGGTVVSK